MRIIVDAYELKEKFTGVGRYIHNLIKNLVEIDPENEYILLINEDSKLAEQIEAEKVKVESSGGYFLWQNYEIKKILKSLNYDFFWGTNYFIPFFLKKPSFATIHDISWRTLKDNYTLKERLSKELRSIYTLKRAKLIFTVSHFTRSEILKYYRAKEDKIKPIYSGIEEEFHEEEQEKVEEFRKKYNLPEKNLIGFLGSVFKRRHLPEVFYSIRDSEYTLFVAGKIYDKRFETIVKSSPQNLIYFERIPEEEILSFYSSIELFVYVSEYEGFGFPPLEALSCGRVPLLYKGSSLFEIFKDFSLFVNSSSPEEIRRTIDYFFANKESIQKRIIDRFKKEKERFSWKKTALNYLNEIKKLY